MNDIKLYERPSLLSWKLSEKYKNKYADRLDMDLKDFQSADLNVNWKNKNIFVDAGDCADLEEIILKACKDLPNLIFLVVPEFKERLYWDFVESFLDRDGSVEIDDDSDVFTCEGENTGFRIWKSFAVSISKSALFKFMKQNSSLLKLMKENPESGEVLRCRGFESVLDEIQDFPDIS